jgi:curved DNA-binding protein CbpA
MAFTDYYALLKIDQYATNTEIRRAYLKRCKEWHPDKNSSIDTTKMMQLINQAKDTLLDQSKRAAYNVEYNLYKSKSNTHKTTQTSAKSNQDHYTGENNEYQGAQRTQLNNERFTKLKKRVKLFKATDEYMYQLFQEQVERKSWSELTTICANWTQYSIEFLDLAVISLHEKYFVDIDSIYGLIKKQAVETELSEQSNKDWSKWILRILFWGLMASLANSHRR